MKFPSCHSAPPGASARVALTSKVMQHDLSQPWSLRNGICGCSADIDLVIQTSSTSNRHALNATFSQYVLSTVWISMD